MPAAQLGEYQNVGNRTYKKKLCYNLGFFYYSTVEAKVIFLTLTSSVSYKTNGCQNIGIFYAYLIVQRTVVLIGCCEYFQTEYILNIITSGCNVKKEKSIDLK